MATARNTPPADPATQSRTTKDGGGTYPASGYFAAGTYHIRLRDGSAAAAQQQAPQRTVPAPAAAQPQRRGAVKVVSDATSDGLETALRYAMRPDDSGPEAEPVPSPATTTDAAADTGTSAAVADAHALLARIAAATEAAAPAQPEPAALPAPAHRPAAARRGTKLVVLTLVCIAGGLAAATALHPLRPATTQATPEPAAAPVSLPLAMPSPAEPEPAVAAATPIQDAAPAPAEPAAGDIPPTAATPSTAEATAEPAVPDTPVHAEATDSSPAAETPSAQQETAAVAAAIGTEPAAAAVTPPGGELYVVQIAAYRTEKTARRVCEAIAQRGGFDLETIGGTTASLPGRTGGGGWFYCRSRRAMPLDKAKEMQRRLRATERAEPLLLPSPGADAG